MAGGELRRSKAAARTWGIQPDDSDPAAPVFEMTGEDLGTPSTRSSPSMSAPSSDNRGFGGSPRLMPAPEVWRRIAAILHGPDPRGGRASFQAQSRVEDQAGNFLEIRPKKMDPARIGRNYWESSLPECDLRPLEFRG